VDTGRNQVQEALFLVVIHVVVGVVPVQMRSL